MLGEVCTCWLSSSPGSSLNGSKCDLELISGVEAAISGDKYQEHLLGFPSCVNYITIARSQHQIFRIQDTSSKSHFDPFSELAGDEESQQVHTSTA